MFKKGGLHVYLYNPLLCRVYIYIHIYTNCVHKGAWFFCQQHSYWDPLSLIDRSTREFFTHMETSPLPVKDLCSALMAIEQWGFFSVPLWHGPSAYKGLLRGPVTFTPVAESLAVELSIPVRLRSVAAGIWTPNLLLAGPTL